MPQSILEDWDALQQEIAALRNTSGTLSGRLSVGVIPSALLNTSSRSSGDCG